MFKLSKYNSGIFIRRLRNVSLIIIIIYYIILLLLNVKAFGII